MRNNRQKTILSYGLTPSVLMGMIKYSLSGGHSHLEAGEARPRQVARRVRQVRITISPK